MRGQVVETLGSGFRGSGFIFKATRVVVPYIQHADRLKIDTYVYICKFSCMGLVLYKFVAFKLIFPEVGGNTVK